MAYMNNVPSDASFSVGKEGHIIRASRKSLSAASQILRIMFTLMFKEDELIPISDVSPVGFIVLLDFVYSDNVFINNSNWAPTLYASRKFGIHPLKEKCLAFAKGKCKNRESLSFYAQARKYSVLDSTPFIEKIVISYIERSFNFFDGIKDNEELMYVLSLDALDHNESKVFEISMLWANRTGSKLRLSLGPALYSIRFPLMTQEEFERLVVPTGALTPAEINAVRNIQEDNNNRSPFSARPRIRKVTRMYLGDHPTTLHKHFSVTFSVDKAVRMHGFDICLITNRRPVISGSMTLKSVQSGRILGMERFESSPVDCLSTTMYFGKPFLIKSHTDYTVSTDLDVSGTKYAISGTLPLDEVTVDGVKWTFNDDSSEKDSNTGQIPSVCFSRLK